jgi:hypothetical protein
VAYVALAIAAAAGMFDNPYAGLVIFVACHTPMRPQFTAWQQSPHSRIPCVSCHIGEGARAMIHYKMAGACQLVHLITNTTRGRSRALPTCDRRCKCVGTATIHAARSA